MTTAPQRVTDQENAAVEGKALCAAGVWTDHQERVEELRARQDEYRASLPTDPAEALAAARKHLSAAMDDHPWDLQLAQSVARVLSETLRYSPDIDKAWLQPGLAEMADLVEANITRTLLMIERLSDILGNPARVERENGNKNFAAFASALSNMSDDQLAAFWAKVAAATGEAGGEKPQGSMQAEPS